MPSSPLATAGISKICKSVSAMSRASVGSTTRRGRTVPASSSSSTANSLIASGYVSSADPSSTRCHQSRTRCFLGLQGAPDHRNSFAADGALRRAVGSHAHGRPAAVQQPVPVGWPSRASLQRWSRSDPCSDVSSEGFSHARRLPGFIHARCGAAQPHRVAARVPRSTDGCHPDAERRPTDRYGPARRRRPGQASA